MSFTDKIKGAYFYFEDKWYSVLDKINKKIPVYKVIDPIDRVIPSFILFLLVVLFLVILAGYLIQFSSPYDITIITHNSTTKLFLSGVAIKGELNEEEFDGTSDTDGEFTFQVTGVSKNFFGLLGEIIFPAEPAFEGYITATKTGFEEIKNKTIDLTSTQHKIYLSPLPDVPEYPSSTVVELRDSDSSDLIVSSDSLAYVKFKCNNKTITQKTVRDDSDGTKDGKFTLSEDQCQFVVTSAFSTGYQVDSIQKVLPTNKSVHQVSLDKTSVPTTGTAKVYVYDLNSPDTNRVYLDGIKVIFNSTTSGTPYAWTNANGVAEKTLTAGTYTITIADENYYEITSSDNITIDIEVKNDPTELSIGLEKIVLSDRRQIYFKVVDGVDGNVVTGVNVDLLWLNVDTNGNYFGTDGNSPATYNSGATTPTQNDSNGLFKSTNVTVRKEGQLVAILKKENYVYKVFKPTFFKLDEGPQVVTIDLATATNSGRAQITVNAGDNNRPLASASAYLYDDLTTDAGIISGIPLEKNGILTSTEGMAAYSNLAIGPTHAYSAEARFSGVSSGQTTRKSLDANQTIFFSIHMNLNVSYLEIELYDFETRTKITTNLTNANIKLYTVGDDDFSNKTLSESIEYKFNKFISSGYDQRSRLLISVDLNAYISNTITLDGITNPLSPGNNKIKVFLIPRTMVSGDVDIFFDNIYLDTDNILDGTSLVSQIDQSQKYKLRFFAVIDGNKDFDRLQALERTIGKTTISNISGMEFLLEEQNAFTCNTSNLDSSTGVHDDNYYFPTGTACSVDGQTRTQAGFKWASASLPKGTYSYIVTFDVNSDANLGDKIKVQYRAKETHDTNIESETALKEIEFEVEKPLLEGVYFTVKIDTIPVIFNSNSNISEQVRITPNNRNEIKIRVNNNTNANISNGVLKIFSYSGETKDFNPDVNGNGLVHFDSRDGPKQKTISSQVTLNAFRSNNYTADAYPEKFNSSNWIVIVLEEGGIRHTKFIDAMAWGKDLTLDAEFIAGILDQPFDGTVYPRAGDGSAILTSVEVEVRKDCKGDNTFVSKTTATTDQLDGQRFVVTIPGMYEYEKDCVYVSAIAKDAQLAYSFNPIDRKRIMATSGSGRDPALSCVDITDEDGETTDSDIAWDEEKWVSVRNNCAKAVDVIVETGLLCARDGEEAKPSCIISKTLGVGDSAIYNLTGRNADYVAGYPDLNDTIGLFPIYVKAKFVGRTGNNRWILADSLDMHLTKENSCFSISSDKFDFVASSGAGINFNITNDCQYADDTEFFFPKTILQSFGFEVDTLNNPVLTPESFEAKLVVTGKTYETYYEDTNVLNYLSSSIPLNAKDLSSYKIPIEEYTHYTNARFDLNDVYLEKLVGKIYWAVTKFQFQFYDRNPEFEGYNPKPYGASIDGDIIVNYTNGTSVAVTPKVNFAIDPDLNCSPRYSSLEYCELTITGTDAGDNNLDVGIIYVVIPKGKVDSIDMNLIGGDINDNLSLRLSPFLEYTKRETKLRENATAGETDSFVSLGTYSIYPIGGAEFIIKHIDDLNNFGDAIFTEKINPRMYLTSTNPKVVTWIEQGYLKAKYIGTNVPQYDDGVIDLTMEKTFGGGVNYSILNIADFVSKTIANSHGKNISGVR